MLALSADNFFQLTNIGIGRSGDLESHGVVFYITPQILAHECG